MFMTEFKTINFFGVDFMDVFGVGKDENRATISEKQQLFINTFVHGFDHNLQLVNHFRKGFEELGN
jgi:hypothetical protein